MASKLWDSGDVRNLRAMTDEIHKHGALAGVSCATPADWRPTPRRRAPAKVVSQIPSDINYLANGRELRSARSRSSSASTSRVSSAHVTQASTCSPSYAGLGAFPMYFLYPFYNKRTDEYGGSFENRVRFTREVARDASARRSTTAPSGSGSPSTP